MYEETDLDRAYLDEVDRLTPSVLAKNLGVGMSTVYTQASKIREERGSLSGNVRTQFIEYLRTKEAETREATGREPGPSETGVGHPEDGSSGASDEPIEEAWTSDWEVADITGERRRLRGMFDQPNHVAGVGATSGPSAPLGRIPGVVPERPYDDEEAYFGREVAALLRRRRHLLRLIEDVRRANPVRAPYEHSVYEQLRRSVRTDLRYLEFALVDEHGLTLSPHVVPTSDMQRVDVLESLARRIEELDRGVGDPNRSFLEFLTFVLGWSLGASFQPSASGKFRSLEKAIAVLAQVDSRADEIQRQYSSYADIVEDLPRQREYAMFVRDRQVPSRFAQPYEHVLHELVRMECLLEYRLLEYAVVRPFARAGTRLSNNPDGAVLTGMEADVYDIMVRIERGSGIRWLMNLLLFVPWWALRALTWPLSMFRRKTA